MPNLCICGHDANQHNQFNKMCAYNNYSCSCMTFRSEDFFGMLKRTKNKFYEEEEDYIISDIEMLDSGDK